jgi:hypothetical protein
MNPPRPEPAIGSAEVLAECESFIEKYGVSASRLGRGALGDDRFVAKLRAGRDVYLSRVELVRTWMDGYSAGADDAAKRRGGD